MHSARSIIKTSPPTHPCVLFYATKDLPHHWVLEGEFVAGELLLPLPSHGKCHNRPLSSSLLSLKTLCNAAPWQPEAGD